MSIGRNDPCPCGSGKKYKKCCLAKDEEAARQQASPPVPTAKPKPETPERKERPKPPPDPRLEAWNARYDEFDAADYEERVALFTRTLDERELMDDEMAFEMLNELFEPAATRNERDRYDSLVDSLRDQLPEVYAKEAHFLLENRILNALVMKRPELVDSLTRELALLAGEQIDTWNQVEKRLAYHGYLATLVEAMRLAWPQVRSSRKIVRVGINEFSLRAAQYETLNYIEQTPAPSGGDPVLLERMSFFFDESIYLDRVKLAVTWLAGQMERQWAMDDFELEPSESHSRSGWGGVEEGSVGESDPASLNLSLLAFQFVNYAHRVEGAPYSKAELARREIYKFIVKRFEGDLEYRESMLDSALRSAGQRRGPVKKYKQFGHPLCPDRERLDHFLAGMLDMLGYRPHNAAAMMELVPAWLRFLQTQGLIDAELRKKTLADLRPLANDLLGNLKHIHSDPTLREAIKRWPEEAAKEPD